MSYVSTHLPKTTARPGRWVPWIWGGTALGLLLWTGICLLAAWALGAVLGWLPEDALSTGAQAVAQWPVPEWLTPWIDPTWVTAVIQSVSAAAQWLEPWLPSANTLAGLVDALVWMIWGMVALPVLLVAIGLHFWSRRT